MTRVLFKENIMYPMCNKEHLNFDKSSFQAFEGPLNQPAADLWMLKLQANTEPYILTHTFQPRPSNDHH